MGGDSSCTRCTVPEAVSIDLPSFSGLQNATYHLLHPDRPRPQMRMGGINMHESITAYYQPVCVRSIQNPQRDVSQSWIFTPAMVRVLVVSSPRWPPIFGGDDPTRIRSGDAGLFRHRIGSKPGQKRLSDTFACCQTADNASSRSDIGSSTSSLLLSATDFLTMNR